MIYKYGVREEDFDQNDRDLIELIGFEAALKFKKEKDDFRRAVDEIKERLGVSD